MNKKLAIFPIDRSLTPLVRYSDKLYNKVIPLLSPALKTLANKDISMLDGGAEAGVELSISYEKDISECESVFFCNSNSVEKNEIYFRLIEYAESLNKEIMISRYLAKRLGLEMQPDNTEIECQYFTEELIDIEVPIISIFTSGQNCNQLDVELSLRNYFIDHSYNVIQVGTDVASELFGFLKIPEFLYDDNLSIVDRIIKFNRYIYNLSKKNQVDVIILGVPESIMKYNNQILNGLGIIPFIIQSAIQSDVAILSLYQNNYPREYYERLQQYCKYRLGISPKYFSISNSRIMKNIDDNTSIDYLFLKTEYVIENIVKSINDENITIFSPLDIDSGEEVYKMIERELISNVCRM